MANLGFLGLYSIRFYDFSRSLDHKYKLSIETKRCAGVAVVIPLADPKLCVVPYLLC